MVQLTAYQVKVLLAELNVLKLSKRSSIRVVVDSTDILKNQTIASNDKTLASFKHQKSLKNNKWIGRISHFAS